MEKKKIKILISIIIILSLLLIGSGGYIIYQKINNKEKQKKEPVQQEETEKITEEELTEEEKNILLDQISEYNSRFATEYPMKNVSEIANQEKLYFGVIQINKEGFQESFSTEKLSQVMEKYFSNKASYTDENIQCVIRDGVLYQYNEEKKNYQYQGTHGHGGGSFSRSNNYYVEGNKKKNTYTIKVQILYETTCSDICGPTSAYYSDAEAKNIVYEIPEDKVETIQASEVYPQVKEKLPITTFTFIKDEDGNYGLDSVIIEK